MQPKISINEKTHDFTEAIYAKIELIETTLQIPLEQSKNQELIHQFPMPRAANWQFHF